MWGFPVLSRSPSTPHPPTIRGLPRCLATGHRCVPTLCLEALHGTVFLLVRLPATSLCHPSLFLLRLHLPVLLQRLLQPLSLVLQLYLIVASSSFITDLSTPDDDGTESNKQRRTRTAQATMVGVSPPQPAPFEQVFSVYPQRQRLKWN